MNSPLINYFGIFTLSLLVQVYLTPQVSATTIDCYPLTDVSKEKCESLGCVWKPKYTDLQKKSSSHELPFNVEGSKDIIPDGIPTHMENIGESWCTYPDDYIGYDVVGQDSKVFLMRKRPSGLPDDINKLTVELENYANSLRIKIYDPKNRRFEPEIPVLNIKQQQASLHEFHHEVSQKGHLVVRRRSTGAVLFDTDLTKLIFSDKFIQLNSKLNSPFVYGLGEHYDTFLKKADSYKAYTFYNTDKLPLPGGQRSYGGFPFYVNLDSNEKFAHGVYLHNSNAMDIYLQADQSITFRPIGGVLDFILFVGPTPNDVISQYQHMVGLPDLPPRWSLGFHLCRYGYNSLEKTEEAMKRTRDAGIPFDVQWNDIDYMDKYNDFTYDHDKFKGLPEFVDKLHNMNMHYVVIYDPGVSQEENYYPYSLGERMDIFVKNATNQTLVGKVWNDSGRTVFPDFSNKKSIEYWSELFTKFQSEVKFDGAWIDMNDISSFVDGSLDGCPADNPLENPPYKPGYTNLQQKSLCLSAKHAAGYEYDMHNLYSFYEAISTFKALQASRPGKRPFIISRSTAPGQGHYGGHWSGDVLSTWDYLRWSIPSLIEHSMYGFSIMGSDICGFGGNTNPELCARWSTLGAFYTFSRNHNENNAKEQDPVIMGPDVVAANKNALTKKYSLLPYLYSLIHRAHRYGEPSIRSVPFEFYTTDKEALKVEYQFMWGKAIMISPVVEQNSYTKSTYLPKGRWYETNVLPSNKTIKVPKWIDSNGEWHETKDIALYDIPIFYSGGHIVPIYPDPRQTVPDTVNQPIGLEIALCPLNKAHGELFIDDGDNVDDKYNHVTMDFDNNKLTIVQDHDDYAPTTTFGQMKIFGLSSAIHVIKANNKPISFERSDHVLSFDLGGMTVSKNQNIVVEIY